MRSIIYGIALCGLAITFTACDSSSGVSGGKMESMLDSASYAIGMNSGSGLKELMDTDSLELDIDLLLEGLRSAVEGKEMRLSDSVSRIVLMQFQEEMNNLAQARNERKGAESIEKGNAYLAENKAKPGVQVTASGLQYRVIEEGTGASPDENDEVTVEYAGRLIDGTEFDASQPGNPVTFPVNGVIRGWTEALQMMKPGSKWEIVLPADIAYGAGGSPPKIGPNETLVFDVKLISVKKK